MTKRVLARAILIALAVASCGPRGAAPLSAFEGRMADWTREILADSPELATEAAATPEQAGGAFADRLDDRSPLAAETRRTAALRRDVELRALNVGALDPDQRLTLRILRERFDALSEAARFSYGEFSPLGGIHPYVLNQLDSAYVTLPEFFELRQPMGSIAEAETYLARLAKVAPALDQETERARRDAQAGVVPPWFIIDPTLAQLDAIAATPLSNQAYFVTFKAKLDALIAAQTGPQARAEIATRAPGLLARAEQIVRDRITPAHQRAAQALRALRAQAPSEAGVWRLPEGEAYYRAALRLETTTALTPDQIHAIGLERVRALTAELDVALRRIGQTEGPVSQRLSAISNDPRYRYPDSEEGRARLLADIQARQARMMAQAPQWFGALPRARLEVRRVPLSAEASQPGAYYSPPSLDGATPGIYFVNLRNLAEMTRIDVPTQDFHEAAPGHHFQTALAREQADLPLLRRLLSFNAYSEGWALYAEQLADELGFYDEDPIGRIGFLRWQLWRAARLVVDTGLHAKRWSRDQAIAYLAQTTGDAPGTIATEVDRYVVWPGQACGYELGRREIMALREEARAALGPDFELRGFHDSVLASGETPLNVLDAQVRAWIPRQREAAAHQRRRP